MKNLKNLKSLFEKATLFGNTDDIVAILKSLPNEITALDGSEVKEWHTSPDREKGIDDPERDANLRDHPRVYDAYRIDGELNPDYKSLESVLNKTASIIIGKDKNWVKSKNVKGGYSNSQRTVSLTKAGFGTIILQIRALSGRNVRDGEFFFVVYVQKAAGESLYKEDEIVISRARAAVEGLTVGQVKAMERYIKQFYNDYGDDDNRKVTLKR